MNISEEDVDLGLALGSTYYSAQTQLNSSSSGAGVNADSRVDMAFAASDPLSELVWSPHNGLSLKCTNLSLPNRMPFDPWNAGLGLRGSEDEKAVEEKLTTILEVGSESGVKDSMLRSSRGNSYPGCAVKMDKEGGTTGAMQGPSSSHNGQIADIAECSKRNAEQDVLSDDGEVNMETKQEFSNSEPRAVKLGGSLNCSLPILVAQQEPDDEVTSSSREITANKTRKPIAIPASAQNLMILESSAENDLGHPSAKEADSSGEASLQREGSCPVDRSPVDSRIRLYHEKGKAKALSEGDIYGRSNDEDDSNESMESCNSTGLFSKGVKRQTYDEEQLVGSKRLKMQMLASHGSASLVRPDSSFVNWISNMVRGLLDSNKEGSSSLSLTLARSNDVCGKNYNREDLMCKKPQDCESPKVGFQSMFQSLYCRNTKGSIHGLQKDTCSLDESKELMVANERSLENVQHFNSPCKQIILRDNEGNRHASRNTTGELFNADFSCTLPYACEGSLGQKGGATLFDSFCKQVDRNEEDGTLNAPLPIRCMPLKSSPLSSLWITRLYNKAARLESCDQVTDEATEFPKPSVDAKSYHKPSSVQSPQKSRASEAMASVFAKRLDAFKHVSLSEKMDSPTCAQICFFCGGNSHDLRTCPKLTEAEHNDLLIKISAFDRIDRSPSFCIKCFQFDHWASSCPSTPLQRHGQSQHMAQTSFRVQLCPLDDGGEEDDHKNVYPLRKRPSTSNSYNEMTNTRKLPRFNFMGAQSTVAEGEMFHVITKLRLSRCDVLRWMNSNESLSHLDGFFLRLRLGSLEAGLVGTGYYAARITGDKLENIRCKSKKSILVDVGGIKSSVGSQYVSNHDFLEGEVKAWWSRIAKTGGSIPSLDELNSKFEERKCLGF